MKNMKIRSKLFVGFMAIALLMIIAVGYGIFTNMRASDSTQLLSTRATSAILTGYLETNLNQQRAISRDSALAAPIIWNVPSIFEDNKTQLSTADNEFNALITQLGGILVTEESKAILRDIAANYADFHVECENLIKVLENSAATPEQVVAALDASTPPYIRTSGSIEELSEFFDRMTNEQASAAADQANLVFAVMIAGIMIALIIVVVLSMYISGLISKPLGIMAQALDQIGTKGDLQLTPDMAKSAAECSTWKEEIGTCARAVGGLIGHLTSIEKNLALVADGDLSITVNTLSDRDNIGLSVSKLVDNLSNMFSEINAAASQVSSGSTQIADGAQLLAQGATEQSATVEELSASVTEISEQTKRNAELANEAQLLGNSIKESADQGNRQMEQMIQAVREISESSQSIGKVIKIIDDIAFQTNILALNAAVEAARAGQHGKGFAVVADEVRNLAAKSAEAAKDTGALIETSIEKSDMGARISSETAASLAQIVEGILNNSELVAQISKSSGEQASAIAQVSEGINQVSQVVQQNSATAEENAAASEEMNGQADLLQSLIAQFKLRDGGEDYYQSLPPGGNGSYRRLDMPGSGGMSLSSGKY